MDNLVQHLMQISFQLKKIVDQGSPEQARLLAARLDFPAAARTKLLLMRYAKSGDINLAAAALLHLKHLIRLHLQQQKKAVKISARKTVTNFARQLSKEAGISAGDDVDTVLMRLDALARRIGGKGIGPELSRAAYNFAYARNTGRISGNAEMELRKLRGRQIVQLIAMMIARNMNAMGIARYLNLKYNPRF